MDYVIEKVYDSLNEIVTGSDGIGVQMNKLREIRDYVSELIDDLIYLQEQDGLEDHPADHFPFYRGD